MGGSGIISKVFEYNYSPQFSSSVLVDILDRFPVETSASSPCVLNSLQVLEPDPDSTAFKLVLLHQGGLKMYRSHGKEDISEVLSHESPVWYPWAPWHPPTLCLVPSKG